ncbi:MAG: peptide ABC transporter substrate-binding protein [candidate division Zixibacteria bacterium]|nr:peptide ABC transporter substrate-binding protein [candidate division Zixibacteria bacterium]
MDKRNRKNFRVWVCGLSAIGVALAFCLATPQTVPAPLTNSVGRVLPSDAAAPDRQIFRYMFREPTTLDIGVAAYEADGTYFAFERLTLLDENNLLVPGAADRWVSSPDGKTWTFSLRPGAKWSDGRPVTAHDFVYSYRRMLDPASGNVYAFLYYVIKGGKAYNQGQLKNVEQVGIRAINDLTFQMETEGPCPYLPYITAFITSSPAPHWQVEKYGAKWTEPEYCVSNFTYRLAEWKHGQSMTFALDPNYNGSRKAYLEKILVKFIGGQRPGTAPYENGEIDAYLLDPLDYARVRKDPKLNTEVARIAEFTTWYLFFKTASPPFNDLRVRRAIAKAIDRETLCRVVLNDLAIPAYSMLPPGFPGYAGAEMKSYQAYDPEKARALMAEAGFPGGRGFPATELWLRIADTTLNRVAAEAIQAMLKKQLGITLNIQFHQRTLFNDRLVDWQIPMGMLAFAYDYPDPSNMLGLLWRSQPKGYGRHDWQHGAFDRLIDQANTEMNAGRRYTLYTQAERILAEEAGAVFLFHPMVTELRKPYLRGIKKDASGRDVPLMSIQTVNFTDVYVAKP